MVERAERKEVLKMQELKTFNVSGDTEELFQAFESLSDERVEIAQELLQVTPKAWNACIKEHKKNACYYSMKHCICETAERLHLETGIPFNTVFSGLGSIG